MRTIQYQTWRDIPYEPVKGNPNAKSREQDPEMKTWTTVAVMKVSHTVPFFPFFFNDLCPTPQVSNHLVYGTRYFAMRIGPEDVNFGVLPAGDTLVATGDGKLEVWLEDVFELGSEALRMFEEVHGEIELC